MEKINNTLISYIKDEEFYKNILQKHKINIYYFELLTKIHTDKKFKKLSLTEIIEKRTKYKHEFINYIKVNLKTNYSKKLLFRFITNVICTNIFEDLNLELMDLLDYKFMNDLCIKKNKQYMFREILRYYIYKRDEQNYELLNNFATGYIYIHYVYFYNVIDTKNKKMINIMFNKLYTYLDNNNIDIVEYNELKDCIKTLEYYKDIVEHDNVDILIDKIKKSYIKFLQVKIQNTDFFESDDESDNYYE